MTRIVPTLLIAAVLGVGARASAQVRAESSDEFDVTVPKPVARTPSAANADDERPRPEAALAATVAKADTREAQRLRVFNTWFGPSGGLHVVDAGSGPAGTFGLQLGVDFFSTSDFLYKGDHDDYSGATFAARFSVTDYLELFAAMASHANNNDQENPELLQVLGDTHLGVKAYYPVLPWLTLGGDFRLVELNSIGSIGPVFSALSYGLRGNATADLRALHAPVPLIVRANLDYFFDNSANLIEPVEAQRLAALQAVAGTAVTATNEDRHLLRRVERFALGINRTDSFGIALGVEAPLRAADQFFVHPMLEWTLGVPVNRRGYSCLLVAANTGPSERRDGCLDVEGFRAMPSTLTLGVRVLPKVRGLAVALGVDIGVSGASDFVRELAGNKPYDVLLALSYAVDPREQPATAVREVTVVREVHKAPPANPRIEGVVVDVATGAPVPQAAVHYLGAELTAQETDAQGKFVSYELSPGEARLEVSHPDYESRICTVQLPVPVADKQAAAAPPATTPATGKMPSPNPYFHTGAAGSASSAGTDVVVRVALRCELTAKPRSGGVRGRVVNPQGQPVAGADVQLTGASSENLTTDAQGEFANSKLAVGSYNLRVEAPGYMIRLGSFDVKPADTAKPELTLEPQPKQSQVQLTTKEVHIRKELFFKTSSAELSEKSAGLISEIADVLLRNPQILHVEIQGHTDNTGAPEANLQLSQARAESVRAALISAGVDGGRLTAKGYGDTRPLVPNLTERHRARNRRVQFILMHEPE